MRGSFNYYSKYVLRLSVLRYFTVYLELLHCGGPDPAYIDGQELLR